MSGADGSKEAVSMAVDAEGKSAAEPGERGRHEREHGTRVVTLELSQARLERLVARGFLDDIERDDRTIAAALKALIESDEAPADAAPSDDGGDFCVPVSLDPVEQEFMLEAQLLPVHGRTDRHGMARVFLKLLAEARERWLQFHAPRQSAERVAVAAAPLSDAALAEIQAQHQAMTADECRAVAPVRLVPREAQKAYLRSWQRTGVWPKEWGPLPDEPGTVVVDEEVRAVFGLDPIGSGSRDDEG